MLGIREDSLPGVELVNKESPGEIFADVFFYTYFLVALVAVLVYLEMLYRDIRQSRKEKAAEEEHNAKQEVVWGTLMKTPTHA